MADHRLGRCRPCGCSKRDALSRSAAIAALVSWQVALSARTLTTVCPLLYDRNGSALFSERIAVARRSSARGPGRRCAQHLAPGPCTSGTGCRCADCWVAAATSLLILTWRRPWQVAYNAVLRNAGDVRGDDIYAGRAGVALAFLRTAEVLRRGKLRLQAPKDGDAHDDAAEVRRIL